VNLIHSLVRVFLLDLHKITGIYFILHEVPIAYAHGLCDLRQLVHPLLFWRRRIFLVLNIVGWLNRSLLLLRDSGYCVKV